MEHDTTDLGEMFHIDGSAAGADNEVTIINTSRDGRFGNRSFSYINGAYSANSPDQLRALDGGDPVLVCQQNRVRGIYYDGGNYRTYGQSVSFIGMRNDRNFDRKEYLQAILNELAGYQGTISGRVINNMTEEPVAGATIRVENSDRWVTTDENGVFLLNRIANERINLIVAGEGYTGNSIDVNFDGNREIELEIRLLHPELSVNIEEYRGNIVDGMRESWPFVVSNYGDGPLEVSLRAKGVRIHSDPWDEMLRLNGREIFNGGWLQAIHYFYGYFWVAGGGANSEDPNLLYRLDANGNIVDQVEQATASRYGWRDFTSDYEYLYAVDDSLVQQISPETGTATGWAITSPINQTGNIAWDPVHDLFWVSGATSNIMAIDRQGNVIQTIRNNSRFRIYGLAYFEDDPDGCTLYMLCNQADAVTGSVIKLNPETDEAITVREIEFLSGERAGACDITQELYPYTTNFVSIMRSGDESIRVFELASDVPWLQIDPTEVSLDGNEQREVNLWIDASMLSVNQSYDAYIQIDHNTPAEEIWVDLHIGVIENSATDDSKLPISFGLSSVFPNPFNSTAIVNFNLDRTGMASISLYDLSGREVSGLFRGSLEAGAHQLVVNGNGLSAGIYMIRLEVENRTFTRTLTLLK